MRPLRSYTDKQVECLLYAYQRGQTHAKNSFGGSSKATLHSLIEEGVLSKTFSVPPSYVLTPLGYEVAEYLITIRAVKSDARSGANQKELALA